MIRPRITETIGALGRAVEERRARVRRHRPDPARRGQLADPAGRGDGPRGDRPADRGRRASEAFDGPRGGDRGRGPSPCRGGRGRRAGRRRDRGRGGPGGDRSGRRPAAGAGDAGDRRRRGSGRRCGGRAAGRGRRTRRGRRPAAVGDPPARRDAAGGRRGLGRDRSPAPGGDGRRVARWSPAANNRTMVVVAVVGRRGPRRRARGRARPGCSRRWRVAESRRLGGRRLDRTVGRRPRSRRRWRRPPRRRPPAPRPPNPTATPAPTPTPDTRRPAGADHRDHDQRQQVRRRLPGLRLQAGAARPARPLLLRHGQAGDAGVPGKGPWILYAGPVPFTGLQGQRPAVRRQPDVHPRRQCRPLGHPGHRQLRGPARSAGVEHDHRPGRPGDGRPAHRRPRRSQVARGTDQEDAVRHRPAAARRAAAGRHRRAGSRPASRRCSTPSSASGWRPPTPASAPGS